MRLASVLTALLAGLAASCSQDSGAADGPLSAVLITLDTTRQDALGCYGGPPELTPNLDALARDGVLYREARATAPTTLPSHASMLTGLYPPRHGLRVNGVAPLPAVAETLAESARARGLETAAFVAAVVLDSTYGLDQGFDVYDQVARPDVKTSAQYERRNARAVVDAAAAWLERRDPTRPFFLWLHFFDPHQPYQDRPLFLPQAGGDPYRAEVGYMDQQIGRFVDALDGSGLLDRTAIVVCGDHGEARGDHGEETHGLFVYEAVARVPLIVRYPDGHRAGERSDENVSVADLCPTLCEALDLAAPAGMDGISLWGRTVPTDRGVYLESWYGWINYGWSPLVGWVANGRKYLHSATPELYELATDPVERANKVDAPTAAGAVAAARTALAEVDARPRLAPEQGGGLDEELLARMAALGYVFGGTAEDLPDPLGPTDRRSPLQSREELAQIQTAFGHAQRGDSAAAERTWAAVLAANPYNPTARAEHAYQLMLLGRHREAVDEYRAVVAAGPQRTMNWMNLGVCLEHLGEREAAILNYERALEVDPRNPLAQQNLVRALGLEGRQGEAELILRRVGALE